MQTESAKVFSSSALFESLQEDIFKCHLCKESYDLDLHIQKVLTSCGHYLCLKCLKNIFTNHPIPGRQCPSCKVGFSPTILNPEDFPTNLGVLEIIRSKTKANFGYCQEHACKQKVFCITDQVPICKDCHEYGNHKGHHVQLIKVLQDQMSRKKAQLKGLLRENAQKKKRAEQEVDDKLIKMKELVTERFIEMDKILQAKKSEIHHHIESVMKTESEGLIHAYAESQTRLESKIAEITQEISQSEYGFLTKEDDQNFSLLPETNKLDAIFTETEGALNGFLRVFHSLKFEAKNKNEASTQTVSETPETLPTQRVQRMPKLFQRIPQYKKMLRKVSQENRELIKIKTEAESPLKPNYGAFHASDEMEEEFSQGYEGNQLTEKEIQDIKNQIMEMETEPQLKLDFSNKDISDQMFISLCSEDFWNEADKNKLTHIEINFSASSITDQQFIKFIQNILTPLKSLTSIMINLAQTKISSESFQVFSQHCLKNFKLKSFVLNCSQTSIGDEDLKSLDDGLNSSIQTLENIEVILDSTDFRGEQFLDVLSELGQLKHLKLSFEDSNVSSDFVSSIVFCLTFLAQNLESLDLNFNGTEIDDEGLESFSGHAVFHLKKSRYFRLCLGNTFVSDDLLLDFFQSLDPLATQLETFELDLHSTGLTNVSFKQFCEGSLSKMVNLEKLKLDLSQTKITDASLKSMLIPVQRLKSLTLNLNKINLSDSSLQVFKENNNFENLETFNFDFEQARTNDRVLRNSKSTLRKMPLKPTPNSKNLLAMRNASSEYSSDAENNPILKSDFKHKCFNKRVRWDRKKILLEIKKAVLIQHHLKSDPTEDFSKLPLKSDPTEDFSKLPKLIQDLELKTYTELLRQILIKNHPRPDSLPKDLRRWRKTIRLWMESFSKTSLESNNKNSSLKSNKIYSSQGSSEKVFSVKWMQKYSGEISLREKTIEILKSMSTRSWPIFYERILEFVKECSNEHKNWEMPSRYWSRWWYYFMEKENEVAEIWKNLPRIR